MQGLDFFFWYRGHFHLVGQEPHHKDADGPPQQLPGPDRWHAKHPGRGIIGITKDGVTDNRTRTNTEEEPYQGNDPGSRYEVLFTCREACVFTQEIVERHAMLGIGSVLRHCGYNDRNTQVKNDTPACRVNG